MSIQHLFNYSSSLITHPTLKKTQRNPPLKLSKLSQNPIKLPSLKEICQRGSLKDAFLSFCNILADQNQPQNCVDKAYSLLLELCASRKAFSQGQQIHAHILKSNAVHDVVFLSTKLVFLYGKCGSILDAEKLFDRMPERTVFTWNALIGAYVTNGEPSGALNIYREMHGARVPPDAFTFSCTLKASGELKDLCHGTKIHGLAIKLGVVSNVFVFNSIMGMYIKCNDLNAAMLLFDRQGEREDVVSWNTIISAHSADGQSIEALRFFREMQRANVAPSTYTFVAALQACEESSLARFGMEIHAAILKSIHYLDIYVVNALVVMYTRCGKMGEAARVFSDMVEKDIVSWNSMLSGSVQNGLYGEALQLFHQMLTAGQKSDQCSIISLATACGRLGNLLNGKEIHAYAVKNGIDSDLQVGNTLIDMYAKLCKISYMDSVFYRMPLKDLISWTTVITGYAQTNCHLRPIQLFREAVTEGIYVDEMMIGSILLACSGLKYIPFVKEIHGYTMRRGFSDLVLHNTLMDVYGECGYIDYASRIFASIKVKDVVSWTSMISCYVKNGLANEALDIFLSMKETGIEPDDIALTSTLSAVADLSALRKGKEIHGFLVRNGFILEGPIASSLLDMYASCGTIDNSFEVFNHTRDKDLVIWTSMINAFGMHGQGKEAVTLFKMMECEKVVPDHICFLALFNACSHSALVDEGKRFFELMKDEYKLDPWPEHYACIVDLLGRANYLEQAFEFVKSMQMEPTAAVWCALLGACRIHNNEELGDLAAKKLLELEPGNPGNYVLVSNVYAARGRWKEVEKVRMRMKGKGLKKDPACSWIEIGNKVHSFIARDGSHPEAVKIYRKLGDITERLEREEGYVAETRCVLHNVDEKEKVKMLYGHSERLAIAYGLITTNEGFPIRITKNLRVCEDCHTFSKLVSKMFEREIIVRDANRFHHFRGGVCSCGDFW